MNAKTPSKLNAALRGLYAITDPHLIADRGETILGAVEQALQGGARIIQYRNKRASFDTQLQEAKALVALCRQFNAILLVNDSIELCMLAGADGVHLGQNDDRIDQARAQIGDRILGVTCHDSITLAEEAIAHGADYCAFGAIFPSTTKPSATPCSLDVLKQATSLPLPICAIGGIDIDNAQRVIAQEVAMLAVISGIFAQPSISSSAQAIAAQF